MHAAIDRAFMLDAVSDDAAAAMRAHRRQHMDRTFEAVENEGAAAHLDFEALVVIVAALLASRHGFAPLAVPSLVLALAETSVLHNFRTRHIPVDARHALSAEICLL